MLDRTGGGGDKLVPPMNTVRSKPVVPWIIRRRLTAGLTLLALVFCIAPVWAQETGLPLPRFVSLRANEVNLRTGPGVQYPVDWVFHRQNLPVEVIREYRTWRLVRDWQGTQGWVHQSMLSGRRTFIVVGSMRTVRREPDSKSNPIARTEPGVIGNVDRCPQSSGWCQISIAERNGWLRRVELWGVYKHEAVE